MLRIFTLLGIAVAVASGEYLYRSGATPTNPPTSRYPSSSSTSGLATNNRIGTSVLPATPAIPDNFIHNITFTITAENLPSKALDTIDPYFKVYETSLTIIEPVKIGETEVFQNSPNAEFATVIRFGWKRGSNQTLKFKLKDSDRLHDNEISEAVIDADVFAARGFRANLSMSTGGTILIQKTTPLKFKLSARSLPHKDPLGGKSDPYVKCLWRRGAQGVERQFHSTAVLTDLENADWTDVIEFPNYIVGQDLWLVFKVRDSDGVAGEDDLGDTMLELDPYVERRQTKIMRLGSNGQSTLIITPCTTLTC